MELISKGGYSEVFYDPDKKEIYRRSNRFFDNTSHIDFSSITDLIFTKSFEYTGCTPIIHSEHICDKYISFRMPHYGTALHYWNYDQSTEIRKKFAPHIMLKVVLACIYFEKNGFFHSDLKPTNIMINSIYKMDDAGNTSNIEDIDVKVIDFNSSSVRFINDNDNNNWIRAIGTWNYSAPEIILNERPENNSISWNIGVIATIIIDKYCFSDLITRDMENKLVPQDVWSSLLVGWYKKYQDHPPLLRLDWYDEPWKKLIWNCTHWCANKRWSIYEIYNYIYYNLLSENEQCKYINPFMLYKDVLPIQYKIEVDKISYEKREQVIETMYNLCVKIDNMYIFSTAVSIFDRCQSIIYHNELYSNINQLAAASILLSSFIHNKNLLESKTKAPVLIKYFAILHLDDIIHNIYTIGKYLEWKLWEKPVHILLNEENLYLKYSKIFWLTIKETFITQKTEYTQALITKQIINKFDNITFVNNE